MPYTISNIYVPPGPKTKSAYRRFVQVATYPNSQRIRQFSEIVNETSAFEDDDDSSTVGEKRPREEMSDTLSAPITICKGCHGTGFVGSCSAVRHTSFHLYTRKECKLCKGHGFFNSGDLDANQEALHSIPTRTVTQEDAKDEESIVDNA